MAGEFTSALWPEKEHRCLLRAAMLDGPPAVSAFHEWRERITFEKLDTSSFRLLPLLRWNMARLGVQDPLIPHMENVVRSLRADTAMKLNTMREMILVLQEAGIPCLLLKGAAIGQRYYPHPSLRPMGDCDLLIPYQQHSRALEKLIAAGWKAIADYTTRHYSADMWLPPLDSMGVELHWRSGIQATLREDRKKWMAAEPFVFRDVPCHTFCGEDEIIHACRHGFNWSPEAPPMRWLVDCAMIVRTLGDRLDWTRLAERARVAEETLCVRRSLEWIRRELDAPVPMNALKLLRSQGTRLRERRIYALKSKPRDWWASTLLLAEFLNREIPCWQWPLRPVHVAQYFAGQFALPDHSDIIRYFFYRFWKMARARGNKRCQTRLATLAYKCGARIISSTLLNDDFTGLLEEPDTLCWARKKLKLEGFVFARDGSTRQGMRITRGNRILDSTPGEHERPDIAMQHPKQPNALKSGFSFTVDIPVGESRFVIESRSVKGWQPVFEVRIQNFQLLEGAIFPETFPLPARWIHFGDTTSNEFLLAGWGDPEPPARWTNGHKAGMIFGLDEVVDLELAIKLFPFLVPEKVPVQKLLVSLNGQRVCSLELSDPASAVYSVHLPQELLRQNNFLSFELPDATSPADLQINTDTRKLGIHVEWIEFCSKQIGD